MYFYGDILQIHAKAHIVQRKFNTARLSIISLFGATVFWAISHLLLLFL